MRKIITYLFFLLIFLGIVSGLYYFFNFYNNCHLPRQYALGNIDSRFKISPDQVKSVAADSSDRWNEQTGEKLFEYNNSSSLKINLIYDSRQENLDKTKTEIEKLTNSQIAIEDFQSEYEKLVSEYQNDLANYNNAVAYWNSKGGAPPQEYAKLQEEKKALDQRRQKLVEMAKTLNLETQSYNEDLTNLGNYLNSRKNVIVTQGEYNPNTDTINIYTFGNPNELRLVLMHEFGHSLGLNHAQNPTSIMYELLDAQDLKNPTLTDEDLKMLKNQCRLDYKTTIFDKFFNKLNFNFGSHLTQ